MDRKPTYLDAKPIEQLSDKEALIRVLGDYEEAKSQKSDALKRAERYEAIWRARDDPDDVIDESSGLIDDDEAMYANGYLPVGAALVRSASAKLFNQLFSTSRYFELEADDIKDAFFAEEVTAHLYKRHIEMGFKSTIYKALLEACKYDYAITGTRWLLEDGYVPRPRRTLESVKLGSIGVQRQRVASIDRYVPDKVDRCDTFLLPFRDCFHDWESKNGFADSRFFIDARDEMMETLIMESENTKSWGKYKNVEKVIHKVLNRKAGDVNAAYALGAENGDEYVKQRRVTIIRYWTRNHLVEACNGEVIRRMHMPGWCLQDWTLFPHTDAFGGMGLLECMERNQIDINASMNARRNYQNLTSNPFAVVNEDLLAGQQGPAKLYPGWVGQSRANSDPSKQIWVYQPGNNQGLDSVADVQLHADMMQQLSQVPDSDMGQTTGTRTSATEVQAAKLGGISLASMIAQRFENEDLCKIYLNQFYLEQTYLSRAESFKYNGEHGEEFFVIDPASYMWNSVPRFLPRGTVFAGQDAVQTQQFMAAANQAMLMPQVQHDWTNIAIEMWRRLHPHQYWKFVKDPNVPTHNVPPEIENQMFAQGQRPEISPANDHRLHIAAHEGLKRTPDYQVWPAAFKMALDNHLAQHQQGAQPMAMPNPMLGGATMGMQDGMNPSRGLRPPAVGAMR
jgi:hypothetical protein